MPVAPIFDPIESAHMSPYPTIYFQVDAQSILDCMGGGNGGVPAVVRAYHEGLYRSVQGTFKVQPLIDCRTRIIGRGNRLFLHFTLKNWGCSHRS